MRSEERYSVEPLFHGDDGGDEDGEDLGDGGPRHGPTARELCGGG